jgi:hypothetical protein
MPVASAISTLMQLRACKKDSISWNLSLQRSIRRTRRRMSTLRLLLSWHGQQESLLLAQVKVRAASEEDFRAWEGWCHSRFRQLIMLCQPMVCFCTALPACWPLHLQKHVFSAVCALQVPPVKTPLSAAGPGAHCAPVFGTQHHMRAGCIYCAGDCAPLAKDAVRNRRQRRDCAVHLLLLRGHEEEAGETCVRP